MTGVQALFRSPAPPVPPAAREPPPPDVQSIFRQESRYVWGTLRFLGVQERDLEDLMHDVFLTVHRRFEDYDQARPLRPWLFGIALRVAMRYRMLARHRHEVMLGDAAARPDIADERPTPEGELVHRQASRLVAAAIEALTEDHRAIFVMVELQDEPITEVAEGLGLPLNTVYSRLRRARAQFRDAVIKLRGEDVHQ